MSMPLRGIQSAPTLFCRENAKDTAARLAWKFSTSGLKNTLNEKTRSGAPRKSPTALTPTINHVKNSWPLAGHLDSSRETVVRSRQR